MNHQHPEAAEYEAAAPELERANPPTIVDVIAIPWAYDPKQIHYYVVVSRALKYVYSRQPHDESSVYELCQRKVGCRFTGKDGPFYDFLAGTAGKGQAFGGAVFDITLDDGTKFHCQGDVWSCGRPPGMDTVQVGVASQEQLDYCYVFNGGHIDRAVLNDWLSKNEPKSDYHCRDPKEPARRALMAQQRAAREALLAKQAACTHEYEDAEDVAVHGEKEVDVVFERCTLCGHETEAVAREYSDYEDDDGTRYDTENMR